MDEIIERAKKGDKSAEQELFQLLRVRFAFLAKRRLGRDEAEDVAQDACVTVLQKYKLSAHPGNFEAWAYKILRNKIGNLLQHKVVEKDKLVSEEEPMRLSEPSQQSADPLRMQKLVSCLREMIKTYPRYARVLNLVHLGYDCREISSLLQINPNNLYVILNRSRKILRDCISKKDLK